MIGFQAIFCHTNTQSLMKIATRADKIIFEAVFKRPTSHPNYNMYLFCIWPWFPCSHKTLPGLFFYRSSETHYVFLATLANISLKETILVSFSVSPVFNPPPPPLCWETLHKKHYSDWLSFQVSRYLCLYCMVIYHEELALLNNAALSWLTSWPIRSKLSRKYFTDSLCKKKTTKR